MNFLILRLYNIERVGRVAFYEVNIYAVVLSPNIKQEGMDTCQLAAH